MSDMEERSKAFALAQTDAQMAYIDAERRVVELESENTKLREFAKHAIYCAEGDLRCEGCPLRDNSNTEHVICGMHRIAHELGIEVE